MSASTSGASGSSDRAASTEPAGSGASTESSAARPVTPLDLGGPLPDLLQHIVDIESVSGNETALADAVAAALAPLPHLTVERDGDTICARTDLGRDERVVLAGHLDTVPVADNLPSVRRVVDGQDRIYGRGACDMKGGVAVMLTLAAELEAPSRDLTWLFYDHEEVAAELNALERIARTRPDWLGGDFAVLGEPTGAAIEGGCKGTLRVRISTRGTAAHSGRAWLGRNAIHDLAPVLARLAAYEPRTAVVDGLEYHEALSAVGIDGGIASNVVPDRASVTVNYRFGPDTSTEEAVAHVREVLTAGLDVACEVTDLSPGARPGLSSPSARGFLAAAGDVDVRAKQGWTDVARFSALGVGAVNFGPGDPQLAHTDGEHVPVAELDRCARVLRGWLAP